MAINNEKGVVAESNGGLPVNIQDQATDIIDLYLAQQLSGLTLTASASLEDSQVTGDVDAAFTPTTDMHVCLKEGTAFYQGQILAAVNNGGDNWTFTLDTPLDFAYTMAGGCSIINTNLRVDGSVTPQIFALSPARLDPLLQWDITRIILSFTGPGVGVPDPTPDDTSFGTGAALAKGIVLRKVNGTYKNIFNAKTNQDLKARTYDLQYAAANRNGSFGVGCRRTFGGQDKNGVVIRLENNEVEADADQIQIIVQDDLTDQTLITAVVQGHVVGD